MYIIVVLCDVIVNSLVWPQNRPFNPNYSMTYNIPYLDCSAVNSPTLLKIRITEFKDLLKFIISINFNQTLCITFLKSSYLKPMHTTNLCSLQSTIIPV